MNQAQKAARLMWKAADAVTCEGCGAALKEERNLPRLLRKGCPRCRSKQWRWDFPPEVEEEIRALAERMEGSNV